MRVRFSCQGCAAALNAEEKLRGKRIRCPRCREVMQVPLKTTRRTTQLRIKKKDTDAIPQPATPPRTRKKTMLMAPEPAPANRVRRRWPWVVSAVAGCCLALMGVYFLTRGRPDTPANGPAGDAVEFEQKIRAAQQSVAGQGKNLQVALSQSLVQKGARSDQVRNVHQHACVAVEELTVAAKTWPIPPDRASRDLQRTFAKYLQVRAESLHKFGDAIAILEDGSLSLAQKSNQINLHLRALQSAEQKQEQDLSEALERVARERGAVK